MLGILARIWTLFTGPLTVAIISRSFSKEVQGFYYTFSSILATQMVFELGFSRVIMQFISHLWPSLKRLPDGRLDGEPETLQRLQAILRLAIGWFSWGSLIFMVCLIAGGRYFFREYSQSNVVWSQPWIAMVVTASLLFACIPIWALLEGCHQMNAVTRVRLQISVIFSLTTWTSMSLGAGLWTGAIGNLAILLWTIGFFLTQYRSLIASVIFTSHLPNSRSIRSEIWAIQWRTSLGAVHGYFFFQMFTPVMFAARGAAEAGKIGMTWSLISAIRALAETVILTKGPIFGGMVAQRRYDELERLVYVTGRTAVALSLLGAVAVEVFLELLRLYKFNLADRLLDPSTAGCLLLASVFMQVSSAQGAHLRAFAKEPYARFALVNSVILAVGLPLLARHGGSWWLCLGYLADVCLIMVPWNHYLWLKYRRIWHVKDSPE